jgi:hypothetical protein
VDARHGTLGRESEFFVVVRVYVFSSGFNAANQSSAACDRRLQQSVETSAFETPHRSVHTPSANTGVQMVGLWYAVPTLVIIGKSFPLPRSKSILLHFYPHTNGTTAGSYSVIPC